MEGRKRWWSRRWRKKRRRLAQLSTTSSLSWEEEEARGKGERLLNKLPILQKRQVGGNEVLWRFKERVKRPRAGVGWRA